VVEQSQPLRLTSVPRPISDPAPTDNIRMLRFVALCHFVFSLLLLVAAAFFGVTALRVLPHLTAGTRDTRLISVLLLAASVAGPPAAAGVWMAALGRMAWTPTPHARAALLWTHTVLLVAGLYACFVGITGMAAAARSAERGGGLLGPVATLPLVVGVPIVALALCSIAAAYVTKPLSPRPDPGVRGRFTAND